MKAARALAMGAALVASGWPASADVPAARSLDVARPGWVRVALDGPAQAWGLPGERWVVVDPNGAPVPVAVLRPRTGTIEVKTQSVQETAAGWQVVFDLGPAPARHESVLLDLSRPVVAEGCVLEGSDDLAAWRVLARGALFRLGAAPGLTSGVLRHPQSTCRFIRLSWPRKAGLPEFSRARVDLLPEPAAPPARLSLAISAAAGDLGDPAWILASPAAGASSLSVALGWEGTPPDAVRVLQAQAGRWRPAASWRRDPAKASDKVRLLFDRPLPGAARLRVDARGAGRVQLLSADAELPPRWLLFEAPSAGRYKLVSRSAAPSSAAPSAPLESAAGPVLDVALGPEAPERPTPAGGEFLPKTVTLPRDWKAWPVKAPGARPGDVVRVELPVELFTIPGVRAEEIRPLQGDKQLPFLSADDPLPVLAKGSPGVRTRQQGAALVVDCDLPAPATEVRQIELAASAAAGRVRVEAEYRLGRPGTSVEAGLVTATTWEEGAPARAPFSLLLDLTPPEGATCVQLTMTPVEGAAPQVTGARFWRLGRGMSLVWPKEGSVRLVSGFEPLASTGAGSAAFLEWLSAQPTLPAAVDLTEAVAEGRQIERRARFALAAALVIAAAALIFVLARSLGRGSQGERNE